MPETLARHRQAVTLQRKLLGQGVFVDEMSIARFLEGQCRVQFIGIGDERKRKFFENFAIAILMPEQND
jgi:hypothetical protein